MPPPHARNRRALLHIGEAARARRWVQSPARVAPSHLSAPAGGGWFVPKPSGTAAGFRARRRSGFHFASVREPAHPAAILLRTGPWKHGPGRSFALKRTLHPRSRRARSVISHRRCVKSPSTRAPQRGKCLQIRAFRRERHRHAGCSSPVRPAVPSTRCAVRSPSQVRGRSEGNSAPSRHAARAAKASLGDEAI